MNEMPHILLAFITGAALGALFFFGLWVTVKNMITSKMPAVLSTVSFFLRTGITLLGFYYVSFKKPELLIVCLIGFILARVVVKRFTRSKNTRTYEA
ncbi:MAG: ATP synthase subunit I [Taibaiella sp.]|nr:ATP synthase subunit I [Taibaiella sp.]